MTETLVCPNCGQAIQSSKTHEISNTKSVTCNACKAKSQLGQWRLVAVDAARDTTPPSATSSSPPLPPPQITDVSPPGRSALALQVNIDRKLIIPLCIAGAGLLFACLSPFFKWVNVGAGGVTGLAGDGKFMLAINAVAIVAFVTSLMKQQLFTPLLVAIQVWGIVVLFWMGGLLWKLSSIASEPEVRDNLFATMLSTMLVSPGPGLYIGLIGGMCIAGSLGYITATQFISEQRAATFIVIESLALFVGIGTVIALGPSVWPEQGDHPDSKILGLREKAPAKESIIEAELNKPFVLGKLEITPLNFEPITLNERPMLGDVRPRDTQSIVFSFAAKNVSEGEVFSPFSTMGVIDNFGNICPDPTEHVAFSPSVAIESNGLLKDLRPGETAKVMVAFDPQIETAKEYYCTLSTKTSNRSDYKTWQIRFIPGATGGN